MLKCFHNKVELAYEIPERQTGLREENVTKGIYPFAITGNVFEFSFNILNELVYERLRGSQKKKSLVIKQIAWARTFNWNLLYQFSFVSWLYKIYDSRRNEVCNFSDGAKSLLPGVYNFEPLK